ncbi:MAG: hypothetical protein EOP76_16515, partial [Variovorax sp.]
MNHLSRAIVSSRWRETPASATRSACTAASTRTMDAGYSRLKPSGRPPSANTRNASEAGASIGDTLQKAAPDSSRKPSGKATWAEPSATCDNGAVARRTEPSSSVAETRTACCATRPSSWPAATVRVPPARCARHTGRVDTARGLLANSAASRLPSATGDGSSREGKRWA